MVYCIHGNVTKSHTNNRSSTRSEKRNHYVRRELYRRTARSRFYRYLRCFHCLQRFGCQLCQYDQSSVARCPPSNPRKARCRQPRMCCRDAHRSAENGTSRLRYRCLRDRRPHRRHSGQTGRHRLYRHPDPSNIHHLP